MPNFPSLARFASFVVGALLLVGSTNGCKCTDGNSGQSAVDAAAPEPELLPLIEPTSNAPPTPKGMAWIPTGALVAGTPPENVPRKADREMRGEQVILEGFFIDKFAFPNEEGAIPRTDLTLDEARRECERLDKRLCSELEWERACKGPKNNTYEYGMLYQPELCRTGSSARTFPSGYLFSCSSDFGVHDMHGSIWEWTESAWGRGSTGKQVAVRGGNGANGEVVGRCANAEPRDPSESSPTLGFRCCSGPRNEHEVSVEVKTGPPLRLINIPDRKLMRSLDQQLPKEVAEAMKLRGLFRMVRLWEWRPLGNEDLLLAGGCAGIPPNRECGVLVVRRTLGRLDVLGWVSSGHFIPTIKLEASPRKVWVYGGDKQSHYRKAVTFDWGRIAVAPPHRNVK